MEPMIIDQGKKEEDKKVQLPIPRELCAKIAALKTSKYPVIAQCHQSHDWKSIGVTELQVFSKSWLKTRMTPKNLFENQLWVHLDNLLKSRYGNDFLQVRFDNDKIGDNNFFKCKKYPGGVIIGYDGPNNDGDQGDAIEGAAKGVILMVYSCGVEESQGSRFCLFKQHGISSQEYKGVQKKIPGIKNGTVALEYENGFPYQSEPLAGQLGAFALASKDRLIVETVDNSETHLNAFEYTYVQNDSDPSKPDQSFTTKLIASAHGLPKFKRLVWLYGRTLMGLTKENELYVLAVDDKMHTISCFKQKTDRKFKDFALGRPYSQHEMVLVDEQNQLYYANLKYTAHIGTRFLYKKILEAAAQIKPGPKKAKADPQTPSLSHSEIKRVWIYNDLVGLHQAKPHAPIEGGYHDINDGYINYLSLWQKRFAPESIAAEIVELKNGSTKKVEKKTAKKKRRKK
jgi:hypothetical protein